MWKNLIKHSFTQLFKACSGYTRHPFEIWRRKLADLTAEMRISWQEIASRRRLARFASGLRLERT
jgi:hypothetical protein